MYIGVGAHPVCFCEAAAYGMHLWFERVASDDNLSDLPSREEYGLVERLGAVWRAPKVASFLLCGGFPQ